jgi:predicted GNAT family N-acyltransferase
MNITVGNWETLRAHAQPIRFEVFVDEQKVPAEIELDEMDALSIHAVAYDEAGQPLATAWRCAARDAARVSVGRSCRP